MGNFLASFGGFFGLLRWFFAAIVIPVTVWFLALRSDVSALESKVAYNIEAIRSLKVINKDFNQTVIYKLDEMNRSIGRLEGEIKRIK